MSIEGIPDGWELVRVGTPKPGEHVLGKYGKILHCNGVFKGVSYVIVHKIEKPKRYRPFANAAEYMPNWGKPVDWKENDIIPIIPCNCAVVCANSTYLWVVFGDVIQRFSWEEAFRKIWFADGTPFGVEVVE